MFRFRKKRRRKRSFGRGGCGFFVVVGLFACLLLIINGPIVKFIYALISTHGPDIVRNSRFEQAVMFMGPVLLLFIEWWLIDLVMDRWSDARASQDQKRGSKI